MKLIFIHGSGGGKEVWDRQTAHFSGSEAVDLPGHPHGQACPTVEGYVDWLHATLRPAGSGELLLVGHSLGGAIALLYALKYPQDVKGVVTVGSGARLLVSPLILESLQTMELAQFADFFDANLVGVDPHLRSVVSARGRENGPAVMLNDFRACDAFDIMDRLADITVPVLALCGSQDVMTPPKYSHFLAQRLPACRVEIIEGGTHYVAMEKPEQVNQAIAAFLATLA